MKKIVAILLLIAIAVRSSGADRIAASGNASDVQAALDLAQADDTVTIPAGGPWTWTTGVTRSNIPANVTLRGQGTTATGGGDQTIIIDSVLGNNKLINLGIASTGTFRMTGITFQSGTLDTIKDNGTIVISGPGSIRIDHVTFDLTDIENQKYLVLNSSVFGVLDSSILNHHGTNAIYVLNGRTDTGDWMANTEWSLPTALGGADFFFIEDNIINGTTGFTVYDSRVVDSWTGGRVVVRFNDVSQATVLETHATGHSSDDRGTRAQEAYGNKVTSTLVLNPNFVMADVSNGTGVVWGNDATNGGSNVYKNMFKFGVTRANNATYSQSATPNGWGYAGTDFNGTGSNWDGGTYNATDTTYGYPAIDQPGRGQGQLITGSFSSKVNSVTGTIAWPNQALEPIYVWNNTGTIVAGWGGSYYSADIRVQANRDYYPQASGVQTTSSSPFDGTAGTGWGTLANRPTTATTGVGYWATDQGSWNQSTSNPYGVQMNGADGVLYKATATNTWTLYYEPYTYPHPLRGESSPTSTFTPSKRRPLKTKLR